MIRATVLNGQASISNSEYDEVFVAEMRALPGRRWHSGGKYWSVPLGPELRAWAEQRGLDNPERFDCPLPQPTVTRYFRGGYAAATWPFSAAMVKAARAAGGKWQGRDGGPTEWWFPLTPGACQFLQIASPAPHLDLTLPDAPGTLHERLYEHQSRLVAAVERGARSILLADEPGLGKTASALRSAQAVDANRVVVVCPSVVKKNWEKEAEEWWPGVPVHVVRGRKDFCVPETGIILLNFEILTAHVSRLQLWKPDALIIDEGHRIKNPNAKVTRAAIELADWVQDGLIMVLTGTPITTSVEDAIPQLRVLGVEGYLGGQRAIKQRYVRRNFDGYGSKVVGGKHLGELNERLESLCMVRRTKEEVLDLRPRSVVDLSVDSSSAYRASERAVVKKLEIRCKAKAKEIGCPVDRSIVESVVGEFMLEGEGVSATADLVKQVGMSKVGPAIEQATSLVQQGEPVVVMAHHREVHQAILDGLAKEKVKIGSLIGGQSEKGRQAYVDAFQAGDIEVLVASINAAGVGINLHRASQMVLAELPWTDAAQTQAIDRLHRIGQDRPVTCWRLVVEGSTDVTQIKRITQRGKVAAEVMGDGEYRDPGEFRSLGFDHLVHRVLERFED